MIEIRWSYPGTAAEGTLRTTDPEEAETWAANIRRDGGKAEVLPDSAGVPG